MITSASAGARDIAKTNGRVHRNDGGEAYNPSTIFATISRWISDEPPKIVYARPLRYSGTTGSIS